MEITKRLILLVFGLCLYPVAHAQFDSAFYARSIKKAIQSYKSGAGNNDLLYQGTEYADHSHGIIGHPFYDSGHYTYGSIVYNGAFHPDVQMKYDLVRDEVVIKYPGTENPMRLISEKITRFTLAGHQFIRVSPVRSGVATGFYESVYDKDGFAVFIKRQKLVKVPASTEKSPYFLALDFYYLQIGDTYYLISGKKDLLDAFKDQKTEMRKHIKKSGISFKKDKATFIKDAMVKYQSLKQAGE